MKHSMIRLAGFAAVAAALGNPGFALAALPTASLKKVDPATLATGYRTTRFVGSTVFNEANEKVGTIDDLIVTTSDNVPCVVLSVGGFLGVGAKYVVISASALEVNGEQIMLRGATKKSLKGLPSFTYNS